MGNQWIEYTLTDVLLSEPLQELFRAHAIEFSNKHPDLLVVEDERFFHNPELSQGRLSVLTSKGRVVFTFGEKHFKFIKKDETF